MNAAHRKTIASSGPFCAPMRVVELNLERGRSLPAPDTVAGYDWMFALLRLHGVPIGHVQTPVPSVRYSIADLAQTMLCEHGDAMLQHLLSDALAAGAFRRDIAPDLLLDIAHPQYSGPWPPLTVAVCSRDRASDLARCLASLARLDYPDLAILVVDNGSAAGAHVEQLVRRAHPHARYVQEPCPGLNWARRRALTECDSDLIAYVDDDVVVDPGWARALAAVLAQNSDVMAVTGLVVPDELEHGPQVWFERHGGFTRGYRRRWLRRQQDEPVTRRFANTATFGTGANMTFRRAAFARVGLFDPALDAGTSTGAGGDLDMFFRILKAGYTLVYEPAAMVRHRHRRDASAVRAQVENWCTGMQAQLVRSMRAYPEERVALAGLLTRLLLLYYPRRVVQSLWDEKLQPELALAELRGAVKGIWRYPAAYRQALAIAAQHGLSAEANAHEERNVQRRTLSPLRTVRIDLNEPLPVLLPGPDDSDVVQIDVWQGHRRVGAVSVVCGGHPVGRMRIADTIVAGLWRRLLDPLESFRRVLHSSMSLT